MTATRGTIVLSPSLMSYSGRITRRQLKQLSSYPGAPPRQLGTALNLLRVGRGLKYCSGTPFPH